MSVPREEPHGVLGNDMAREKVLALDGGGVYVCQDGPPRAPVLLLVHGPGSSTRTWGPLVPSLARSHRVIRVDLLGHGRSGKPDDGDYSIPAQARRVGAVLDRFGIAHAVAVGHSSGGYSAASLAEQRPDLVTALALISTGPSIDALVATPEAAIGPTQWPPPDDQLRLMARQGFSRPGYEAPQYLIDDLRAMTYYTFTTTMRASRAYIDEEAVPVRLASVGKPVLVIYGEDDRRWRHSFYESYRAVPGARIEMLPGIGHSPNLEDPRRTAALLLAFAATRATQRDRASS